MPTNRKTNCFDVFISNRLSVNWISWKHNGHGQKTVTSISLSQACQSNQAVNKSKYTTFLQIL